jgi:histidyl-tRNA synthetase
VSRARVVGSAGDAFERGSHLSEDGRIERPRGTHDVVPAEMPVWRRVTGEVERLCALYGYRPIVTPVFEDTALFQRTSGTGSDVVQKEMYTFTDRSDRSLTLRPEGTAPICRAYVEHGMHRDAQPQKLYLLAPMYRYGAPGRGRYREHWQASVEAIGSDDPAVDAELIQLYDTLLGRLGVTRYHLELNSIGCRECRPAYLERLQRWLADNAGRLDEATREKAATSPLRVFDNLAAKHEAARAALMEAPTIGESLCEACVEHFAAVRAALDATGVAYRLVPTLVRGLDYYSRTTFEFIGPMENENATITGGGRYDYLVEEIGGPPTPGIGFGAGIERLIIAMEEEGVATAESPAVDVFLLAAEGADRIVMQKVLKQLRDAGLSADMDYAGRSLKGQHTQASRLGARARVRFGPDNALVEHVRAGEPGVEFDAVAPMLVDALADEGS